MQTIGLYWLLVGLLNGPSGVTGVTVTQHRLSAKTAAPLCTILEVQCQRHCPQRPASVECLLYLRFGQAGIKAIKTTNSDRSVRLAAAGFAAGLPRSEVDALELFADAYLIDAPPTPAREAAARLAAELRGLSHGDDTEALVAQQLVRASERAYPAHHPHLAWTRHRLGGVLLERGRLSYAARVLRMALTSRVRVLGRLHPRTADTMASLARVLHRVGDRDAARKLYMAAARARARVLGPSHGDTRRSARALRMFEAVTAEFAPLSLADDAPSASEVPALLRANCDRLSGAQRSRCQRTCVGQPPPLRPGCFVLLRFGPVGFELFMQPPQERGMVARLARERGASRQDAAMLARTLDALWLNRDEGAVERHRLSRSAEQEARLLSGFEHFDTAKQIMRVKPSHALGLVETADKLLDGTLHARHPSRAMLRRLRAEIAVLSRGAYAPELQESILLQEQGLGVLHWRTARGLARLGRLHLMAGLTNVALPMIQRAYAVLREVLGPTHPSTLDTRLLIGEALIQLGRSQDGLAHYRAVLDVANTEGAPDPVMVRGKIANGYIFAGDWERGVTAHTKVRSALGKRLARRGGQVRLAMMGFEPTEVELTGWIASTHAVAQGHVRSGDFRAAQQLLRELSAQLEEVGPRAGAQHAITLEHLAHAHSSAKEYVQALEVLDEAERLTIGLFGRGHANIASLHVKRARLLWHTGRLDQAVIPFRQAARIERAELLAYALGTRSDLDGYRAAAGRGGAFHSALALALERREPLEAFQRVVEWHGLIGMVARIRLDLKRSIDQSPDLRHDLERLAEATADLVRYRPTLTGDPARDDGVRRLLAIQGAEVKALEDSLAERSPAIAARRRLREAKPALVCEALQAAGGAPLVTYVRYYRLGEPRYVALVLSPSDCQVAAEPLGEAALIDGLVDAWRAAAGRVASCARRTSGPFRPNACLPELKNFDTAAAKLREVVFDPLEDRLAPGRVWVVPDGRLAEVPLGSLPARSGGARYLVQRHTFGYASGPWEVHDLLEPPRPMVGAAVIVDDVDYGRRRSDQGVAMIGPRACLAEGATWGRLGAQTGAIADQLRRALPTVKVERLHGANATEATLTAGTTMSGAGLIHLATHGIAKVASECAQPVRGPRDLLETDEGFSRGDPFVRSALVLSGANAAAADASQDDDGILTGREVFAHDLRSTALVVLSACDTGRGDLAAGEGALGLAQAFRIAGARTVVASQWSVPARPTEALFTRFYARAWPVDEPPADRVDALADAQRALVDRYAQRGVLHSGWLWGAFMVSGPGQ